jgi:hypothetical protein
MEIICRESMHGCNVDDCPYQHPSNTYIDKVESECWKNFIPKGKKTMVTTPMKNNALYKCGLKLSKELCESGLNCSDEKCLKQHKFSLTQDAALMVVPPNWTQVLAKTKINFAKVPVQSGTPEYQLLVNELNKDGLNAKINLITRIENRTLWAFYGLKKQVMPNPNEKLLFHGCKTQQVLSEIINNGFDFRIANTGGSVGAGTYFACKANYSDSGYCITNPDGTRELLICHVLVGDSVQGQAGLRRPPSNPATGRLFDSVFNGAEMFVVYDFVQCYPSYIINYSKV